MKKVSNFDPGGLNPPIGIGGFDPPGSKFGLFFIGDYMGKYERCRKNRSVSSEIIWGRFSILFFEK